jgi:hypothetical protein
MLEMEAFVLFVVSGFAQAEHGFGALRVNKSQRELMVEASIRNNVLRIQSNLVLML